MGLQDHVEKMRETIRGLVPVWNRPNVVDFEPQFQALEATIGYGGLMRSLAESPGFQAYILALTARRTEVCARMEDCLPVDLLRLQAQNEELKYALEFVPEAIRAGLEAQERRKSMQAALAEQEKRHAG